MRRLSIPIPASTYKTEFLAGVEFDVLQSTNLAFRVVRRNMPTILEDISDLPLVGYFEPFASGACGAASVEYAIVNINASVPTVSCGGALPSSFEDANHMYNAFEVTLNRRLAGNWSAIASYRFSQLEGNFEGFFRSDNGQSDPAITSLFDFPTNDPTYTQYRSIHGGIGDIRYQGDSLGTGVLPNDRPHQLKLYGNYIWNRFNVGLGFNAISGTSLTALAGNPAYANAGEIPLTVRGEGIQTVDGFMERTPVEMGLDLHADYRFELGTRRVTVLADIFNVFNRRTALNYDNWSEITFGTANPNFGEPSLGGGSSTNSFQAPLSVRVRRAVRLVTLDRLPREADSGGAAQSAPLFFSCRIHAHTLFDRHHHGPRRCRDEIGRAAADLSFGNRARHGRCGRLRSQRTSRRGPSPGRLRDSRRWRAAAGDRLRCHRAVTVAAGGAAAAARLDQRATAGRGRPVVLHRLR